MATAANKFKGNPMDRAIASAFMAKVPPMLWGDPGIGKSSYMIALGKTFNAYVEVLLASLRESQDFLGLPIERNGEVNYAPGAWVNRLNTKGASIADALKRDGLITEAKYKELIKAAEATNFSLNILDEVTTADESTMKALLRYTNEGWVGEVEMMDFVRVILAGNDPDHAVDGVDLPAPMANRVMHIDFVLDAERWAHGLQFGWDTIELPPMHQLTYENPATRRPVVASAVVQYTRMDGLNPGVPEDASKAGKAYPSPRTWTLMTEILSYVHPKDYATIEMVASGMVGKEHGLKFSTFLRRNDLVDPMDILEDRIEFDWAAASARKDELWMLCNGLAAIGAKNEKYRFKALDHLLDCALNNAPDYAQSGVQVLLSGARIPKNLTAKFDAAFGNMLNHSMCRVVDEIDA